MNLESIKIDFLGARKINLNRIKINFKNKLDKYNGYKIHYKTVRNGNKIHFYSLVFVRDGQVLCSE